MCVFFPEVCTTKQDYRLTSDLIRDNLLQCFECGSLLTVNEAHLAFRAGASTINKLNMEQKRISFLSLQMCNKVYIEKITQ